MTRAPGTGTPASVQHASRRAFPTGPPPADEREVLDRPRVARVRRGREEAHAASGEHRPQEGRSEPPCRRRRPRGSRCACPGTRARPGTAPFPRSRAAPPTRCRSPSRAARSAGGAGPTGSRAQISPSACVRARRSRGPCRRTCSRRGRRRQIRDTRRSPAADRAVHRLRRPSLTVTISPDRGASVSCPPAARKSAAYQSLQASLIDVGLMADQRVAPPGPAIRRADSPCVYSWYTVAASSA